MVNIISWIKSLSTIGKIGLVSAAGISMVAVNQVSADDVVTTKTETATVAVAFSTSYQDDESMRLGETKVLTPGEDGSKEITYLVTMRNGNESKREVTNEKVTKEAVAQLSARGLQKVETVTATEQIPFPTETVNDPTMAKGTSNTTAGINGSKVITYEVVSLRGTELSRKVIKEEVTKQPVAGITKIGSKVISNCDRNYTGCVPIASDVDCGGGSGNGPAYLYGTAQVIGTDIYGLDRDGDGYACE